MPRPRKGPRLHLRPARADRAARYVILDGGREIGTGCGPARYREAEQALAGYLAEKYAPRQAAGAGLGDILIVDCIAAYLTGHAPHVARPDFLADTARPLLDFWAGRSLADVRAASCRDYVTWRTAQPVRRARDGRSVGLATARHDLKTLRAAIRWWHKEHGPLPSVPAVTLPAPPPSRQRWLTRAEAAAMLRAARRTRQAGHIARVILLGVYTGTRIGATCGLKWLPSPAAGWIDSEAGVLHRRGAEERQTRKRRPPARIPARLLAHLRRWRRADRDGRTASASVIHYGGQPVRDIGKAWQRVRAAAGLGADVVPHTLRHTAATWLMQAGRERFEIAGFLGMSVATLEDVYGHHHPDFQAGVAAQRLGGRAAAAGAGPAHETPGKPPSNVVALRRRAASNVMKKQGNS